MSVKLCLAQEPEADQLLSENPFALLVAMVLDQQIPLEIAFRGPKKIADRMGCSPWFPTCCARPAVDDYNCGKAISTYPCRPSCLCCPRSSEGDQFD
jgi:uncharacterized HhH-GPD family protein